MITFKYIQVANNIPTEWDELADNYFQQKSFLSHTEIHNPCKQRYYLCFDDEKLVSGAIVYTLRMDLLTFVKVKSPLKMHIVGIPCSVSSPGIFGNTQAVNTLKKYIYEVEKGFVLFLNLEEKPLKGSFASGNTLPTIVLKNNFTDRNAYLKSLRSPYRRRLKLINKHDEKILFEKKNCAEFTEEMYQQYLDVYKKSSGKLEKLNYNFFKNLPADFVLTVCYKDNELIGWNIALSDNKIYYFFLGGINYKLNKTLNTYFRLLSSIIFNGIDEKSDFIELGQTAEIPKMRLGGKPVSRYMEAHHSNLIFNKIFILFSGLLEYKGKLENTHSMKEEVL